MNKLFLSLSLLAITVSCSLTDYPEIPETPEIVEVLAMDEIAEIIATSGIGEEQIWEVYDAVNSSSTNGYDEEYTMKDLFESPGSGVGDDPASKTFVKGYARPLRDLIKENVEKRISTRGALGTHILDANAYISALTNSEIQIYWPYSENWDGSSVPIITYDPLDNSAANVGYELKADGSIEELIVTEEMALERPVWVINRNDDSYYTSLELLRRQDPSWGSGGDIIIGKTKADQNSVDVKTTDTDTKSLLLKTFKANRNYDSWFAGGSEFFVKCGSIEDFTASTEAELALYVPQVTDFLIVVKRSQIGDTIPFNAVLVSEWTNQLENCAFMITEDDGGSQDTWKCSASVKINSKTTGVEISIPIRTRDDIVWRGQLSRRYIEKYSGAVSHFGDVDAVLELI